MKKLQFFLLLILLTIGLAACSSNGENKENATNSNSGHRDHGSDNKSASGDESDLYSTKNVTRLDATNAAEAAVKTSKTIWPATQEDNRPGTVILAPVDQWQIALAAADLIHHPNNGPVLFYEKNQLPEQTLNELKRLNPLGVKGGTEVMVMGDAGQKVLDQLKDYKVKQIKGKNAAEFAANIDKTYAEAAGELPQSVIIVAMEEDAKLYSLAAANWIAHMPEPVLFVTKDEVPQATKEALGKRNNKATIYVLGPESIITGKTEDALKEYGKVTRIAGDTPVDTSIAFAKFKDESNGFGWGLTEPGHGLVFVSTANPEFAVAGAPFAHLGKHAPLIWLENGELAAETHEFLAEIQPTFKDDPTVGPYNHAFLIGSGKTISMGTQGMIDSMLEIVPEGGGGHGGH